MSSKSPDSLFFSSEQIVLQEVPDEISLALSISGCPLRCQGCHSAFTWNPLYGSRLDDNTMHKLLNRYVDVSCVLFYGGEWNEKRLIELFAMCKEYNKKICLYTGLEYDQVSTQIKAWLDFLKTGKYIKNLGGLDNPTTNQRFYAMPGKTNITHLFQGKN